MRAELPGWVKHLTVWLLLGTLVFVGLQAWQSQQQRSRVVLLEQADGGVLLRRSPDGHFHWPGQVGEVAVDFLVDTGATHTALPEALAQRLGLQPLARVQSSTAGGTVQGWLARADITLQGGVQARSLRVTVLPQLAAPLLGMDVLGRLRYTQANGELRIEALDSQRR